MKIIRYRASEIIRVPLIIAVAIASVALFVDPMGTASAVSSALDAIWSLL